MSKIAIIGAGFVGASTAFSLCLSGAVSELALIDVNKEKAIGEALDLNHGLPFIGQMDIYAGDYSDVEDSDIIVVTAGANRKPGETRIDLAKKNVGIMRSIIPEIMKYYKDSIIVVVSNPVDILTYLFRKETGLPASKIIGSGTVLDTSRFRFLISQKCGVDINNIQGYIIGEHGDSAVPVWSNTTIGGQYLDKYCQDNKIEINKEDTYTQMQQSGGTVIKFKGATYYGIAQSVTKICTSVLKNQNSILPVSSVMDGAYGISDVAFSIPSIVNRQGISKVIELSLNDLEMQKLNESEAKLKEILSEVI